MSWKLVALGICCCLGVVATAASLAVLSRLGDQGGRVAGARPVLAVFGLHLQGTATPTDQALAWLAAKVLRRWAPEPLSEVFEAPGVPDGLLVRAYRPRRLTKQLRAVAVGPVAKILQAGRVLRGASEESASFAPSTA